MPYTFHLDSRACSGCKACQIACKDKHQLPVGVLWRRVYEVTGGGWSRRGNAWLSDVFAYNLSIACNHCQRAICVEVCPSRALTKRADGIVLIDADKCLGCQYCRWACPYGALQYDAATGRMTKCTLCADNLADGLPPACVAACPLRVLDLRTGDGDDDNHAVFPLPSAALTRPALAIKPHAEAERANKEAAQVTNREEVSPGAEERAASGEQPLIAFTLLSQMAVGILWISVLVGISTVRVVGGLMLLALLASLFHLGTPRSAWRAIANVRSSWLSREILFATLFAGASLAAALTALDLIVGAALLLGAALLVSMANAYRIRTIAAWDTWRTPVAFAATMLLLGAFSVAVLLSLDTAAASGASRTWTEWLMVGAMGAWVAGVVSGRENFARFWLTLAGIALLAVTALLSDDSTLLAAAALFGWALVLASEVIGRWEFYAARARLSAGGRGIGWIEKTIPKI